jgi:hypothetical protein
MKAALFRLTLLFSFILLSCLNVYAQVAVDPVIFSSSGYEEMSDATFDNKGNMYVLGRLDGNFSSYKGYIITPTSKEEKPAYEYFVAVFDKDSKLVKFSGVSAVGDRLTSIAVDDSGFIYITGGES